MVPDLADVPPQECSPWIARQEGRAPGDGEACRQTVADEIQAMVGRETSGFRSRQDAADQQAIYARRLWTCIEYHWQRFAAEGPVAFDTVVGRLETGDLGHHSQRTNLLTEVILAQALELGDSRAAEMFESEYMPKVRAVARHLGGQRAVDAVDNFAAELIMPRGDRPPRIASFQGRTPLANWLRAVVANFWISQTRKRQAVNLAVLPERSVYDGDRGATIDAEPCDELLRPIFTQAIEPLATEDRLLIKMLVLDGAGQNELARSLKISSGTLTRRRQRATGTVLANVRELVSRHGAARQATNCLELVLAGNDRRLRERLAEVLAAEVRGSQTIDREVDEHV